MGVVNNYGGLLATRLFLGVAGTLGDTPIDIDYFTMDPNLLQK